MTKKAEINYNSLSQLSDKDKAMAIVNTLKKICNSAMGEYIDAICSLRACEAGKKQWEIETEKDGPYLGLAPQCHYRPEMEQIKVTDALIKMNEWKDVEAFAEQHFIKGE